MAVVKPECAVAYAMIGGWRSQNDIITAVAVAIQESGLNPEAANSCCVGLWQINLKAHNKKAADMKNPVANAKAAYDVWKAAGGWCTSGSVAAHSCNPWQAYGANQPGRSWQSALQMATKAYGSVIAKGIGADVLSGKGKSDVNEIIGKVGADCIAGDILDTDGLGVPNPLAAAEAFVAAFNRMGAWITNPDNLMRIVKVGTGFAVILVAGAALMDKEIGSMVVSATPVGKIAKAVK